MRQHHPRPDRRTAAHERYRRDGVRRVPRRRRCHLAPPDRAAARDLPDRRTPPISSTGSPPVVLGPGPLINVPAPPTTSTVDGPGSYQPGLGFGPYLDRAEDGGLPVDPEATGGTDADPDEDFAGTGFSRDEVAEFTRGHTDDNNPAMDDRRFTSVTEADDRGLAAMLGSTDSDKSAWWWQRLPQAGLMREEFETLASERLDTDARG